MAYQVELTDTFGGEANYLWVRRETIADYEGRKLADFGSAAPVTRAINARNEQRVIMRRAKAAVV